MIEHALLSEHVSLRSSMYYAEGFDHNNNFFT